MPYSPPAGQCAPNIEDIVSALYPECPQSAAFNCPSTDLPVYTIEQCKLIEEMTRSQASSDEWYTHRRGRISASIAHRVLTKNRKLAAAGNVDCSSLVSEILRDGADSSLNVPSLQYGRQQESSAVKLYENCQKGLHSGLTVTYCGLFVLPDSIFICATPDRLVNCACCGNGLLEVKCPFSSTSVSPCDAGLPYLEKFDGNLRLKSPILITLGSICR